MTDAREPRDERKPGDARDDRDARRSDDPRDARDPRTLDEMNAEQGRRIGRQGVMFAVVGILVAGMSVIGYFALREPKHRQQADEEQAQQNCTDLQSLRNGIIEGVRAIEAGDAPAEQFQIPLELANGDQDTLRLIEFVNANVFTPDEEGGTPIADQLDALVPERECAAP